MGLPAPQHRRQPDRDRDIRRASFPEEINTAGTGACVLAIATGPPDMRAASATDHPESRGPAMLTLTGNGRLTRDVQLRATHSGKMVATISVASDRRDRNAEPVYLDLIVWQAEATAAV